MMIERIGDLHAHLLNVMRDLFRRIPQESPLHSSRMRLKGMITGGTYCCHESGTIFSLVSVPLHSMARQ